MERNLTGLRKGRPPKAVPRYAFPTPKRHLAYTLTLIGESRQARGRHCHAARNSAV